MVVAEQQRSCYDRTTRAIVLNPSEFPRHWIEEYVHWKQHGDPATWQAVLQEAREMERVGPGRAEDVLATACELFAKRLLLGPNAPYALGWYDRWFLRQQVRRLERFGVSEGY